MPSYVLRVGFNLRDILSPALGVNIPIEYVGSLSGIIGHRKRVGLMVRSHGERTVRLSGGTIAPINAPTSDPHSVETIPNIVRNVGRSTAQTLLC